MQISLSEIIKAKNPQLYRKIPRFVLWIAKKLIHEKDINIVLAKFSHLGSVEFNRATLDYLQIKREISGLENLDENGKYIFASNHPLGGLDGLALVEAIDKKFNGTKVIANDILMNLTPLRDIFLPVNKHGRQTVEYAKLVSQHFEQGHAIIYFPAGLCSRKIDGEIKDLEWKKNFVQKAIEYKRDIIPTFVDELNSPLFYNIEKWRQRLGIKANIGMILLPHELFRRAKRKGCVKIIFGEPVTYKELSTSYSIDYWCDEIRRRSYSLSKKR